MMRWYDARDRRWTPASICRETIVTPDGDGAEANCGCIAPRFIGKTCSRFGNSRAIFNAVNLYSRLSNKLGREVAMSFYVVVGAGPVGRETARLLGEEGHDVILTSRSVGSNAPRNVRAIQADATD